MALLISFQAIENHSIDCSRYIGDMREILLKNHAAVIRNMSIFSKRNQTT
jgi:hypothetical protein